MDYMIMKSVLFVLPLAKEIVNTVARGGILGAWKACHPSHWRHAKKAQSCGILFDQMSIKCHIMEMMKCILYHIVIYCIILIYIVS